VHDEQGGEVLRDAADEVHAHGADAQVDPRGCARPALLQGASVPEDVKTPVHVADADVVGGAGVNEACPRRRPRRWVGGWARRR